MHDAILYWRVYDDSESRLYQTTIRVPGWPPADGEIELSDDGDSYEIKSVRWTASARRFSIDLHPSHIDSLDATWDTVDAVVAEDGWTLVP